MTEEREREPSYAWVVVGVLFFAQAVALGLRGTIGLLVKPWEAEFGWDRAAVSLTASMGFVVYGLAQALAGRWADRTGPRVIFAASIAILGVGSGRRQLDRDPLAGVRDLRRPDHARRRRRVEPHLRGRGRPLVHGAARSRARRRVRRVGSRAAGAGPHRGGPHRRHRLAGRIPVAGRRDPGDRAPRHPPPAPGRPGPGRRPRRRGRGPRRVPDGRPARSSATRTSGGSPSPSSCAA